MAIIEHEPIEHLDFPIQTNGTVKLLEKAKEYVEQGWTQGRERFYDSVQRRFVYCTIGAIRYAYHDYAYNDLAYGQTYGPVSLVKANEIVVSLVEEESIASWNDDPNRTKSEVVSMFDRAIERARAEG